MSRKISFPVFRKEIFNKLGEKQRNKLFYWSLFDPSTWEEIDTPGYLPSFARGKREVLSLLKISRTVRREFSSSSKDEFYKHFVTSEFLTNYLLAAKIQEKLRGVLKGSVGISQLEKSVFPDIILKDTRIGSIYIEIKGIASAKNLAQRVTDEVLKPLKPYKRKYKNFLLLLLFPACKNDNPERVNQLTAGYYIYERLLERPGGRSNRKVLCQCISNNGIKHSLNKLAGRMLNYIKPI